MMIGMIFGNIKVELKLRYLKVGKINIYNLLVNYIC